MEETSRKENGKTNGHVNFGFIKEEEFEDVQTDKCCENIPEGVGDSGRKEEEDGTSKDLHKFNDVNNNNIGSGGLYTKNRSSSVSSSRKKRKSSKKRKSRASETSFSDYEDVKDKPCLTAHSLALTADYGKKKSSIHDHNIRLSHEFRISLGDLVRSRAKFGGSRRNLKEIWILLAVVCSLLVIMAIVIPVIWIKEEDSMNVTNSTNNANHTSS
ncbi:DgyrCDS12913 [Dimorphilus gyrociliatus]|uniref:DgyrCDS12913 n=1 Tax=Dimorphilus gyrociliatus TaxID=2664684 RepID=A0A7I8W941_9ANNE|nr:DgyrCDS12913 [Dimorphilus gyrociliatus]